MKDLTPYLMGDPQSADRRAPTEEERQRLSYTGHDRNQPVVGLVRPSPLRQWPIGETRYFQDRKAAKAKASAMYNKGMSGQIRMLPDGRFSVTRIV